MSSSTSSSDKKHNRGVYVIFGPPGLFIGLTLAALIAGIYISQSTPAAAVPRPASAAATR
jgi:hypothetical protein